MDSLAALLAALATALLPIPRLVPNQVELRYQGEVGQRAEYRLAVEVRGEQTSLQERLPLKLKAELALEEVVVGREAEDVLCLQVRAGALAAPEASGGTGAALSSGWPALRLWMTERGEVLEVEPLAGEDSWQLRQRAFGSLLAQPAPVVLPPGPVAPGARWEWEREGARQTNQLLEIRGEGDRRIARIRSVGSAPLRLEDRSAPLGLTTRVEGLVTQTSQLDFALRRGLPMRHKGEMQMRTSSQAVLELPEGARTFPMQADLKIAFDLRLVRLDGEPVAAP